VDRSASRRGSRFNFGRLLQGPRGIREDFLADLETLRTSMPKACAESFAIAAHERRCCIARGHQQNLIDLTWAVKRWCVLLRRTSAIPAV
jgi:hypothetical protein